MDMGVLTTAVDLFTKAMTALKQLKELLRGGQGKNTTSTVSPAEQKQIAALEGTITAYEKRLNLFDLSTIQNDVQAFQKLMETMTSARLEHQQAQFTEKVAQAEQLAEEAAQALGQAHLIHRAKREADRQLLIGLTRLLGNLLPFVHPELRKTFINDVNLPADFKALFETITWYEPVNDEVSLKAMWDRWRNSPSETDLTRLARQRSPVAPAIESVDPAHRIGSLAAIGQQILAKRSYDPR